MDNFVNSLNNIVNNKLYSNIWKEYNNYSCNIFITLKSSNSRLYKNLMELVEQNKHLYSMNSGWANGKLYISLFRKQIKSN